MKQSTALAAARAWIDADAPIVWLLGKTQSGKTSIVAEITGQAHAEIGRGYIPMTQESRLYAFPAQGPVLRFLDTRGLADSADSAAATEIAAAREQAHLLLVVLRVDDLDVQETLAVVSETRRRQPQLPVIVAQTGLHRGYGPHDRHVEPYPFDGGAEDRRRPGVPLALGDLLLAQRRLFARLRGAPPHFVPLDFTRPEQGIAPADYGAERLWDVLDRTLPEVADRLRGDPSAAEAVRTKEILPWAMAAALANAPPLPVLGGLASAGMQARLVVNIARRFGIAGDWRALWGELVGALGTGFVAGFGGSWIAQQVLKLGLGWGSALVASWTFAATWAIGEVALNYFSEKAAGHRLERDLLRARYRQALQEARGVYAGAKRSRESAEDAGAAP
jgi:uncharacterized protein (DUF697 family)